MKTLFLLMSAAAALGAGCSSTALRENVFASVNTTVGATLLENKRTQLYEVRAGFIRHQFYSIPTGKAVEGTNQVHRPRAVPQVLSGIRVESGARELFLGSEVAENFATGPLGVLSPAAVAMYVSQARTAEYAANAAKGVRVSTGYFQNDEASRCLRQYWRPNGVVNQAHADRLQGWIASRIGAGVDIPDLLNQARYVAQRRQAIRDLGIECD